MLVLEIDNFEKFTVGGNAFQTLITQSTEKKLLPKTICAYRFKQFVL